MNLLGATLTLLVGPAVPVPPPFFLMEALEEVEVTSSDQGRSGFQLNFRVGRNDQMPLDYDLLAAPLLNPMSRVILMVTLGGVPHVLMDGIITNRQLDPGERAGSSTLTVIGEDLSVLMDLEARPVEYPALNESLIALMIIGRYARYGMVPVVIPPPVSDQPVITERIPVLQGTDLEQLQEIAGRYSYVFYLVPGPAPATSQAYWGPPVRAGAPQRPLRANLGPDSNVDSINFQFDGLAPTQVQGQIQDRRSNQAIAVRSVSASRPPLAAQNPLVTQRLTRVRQFMDSGLDATQAFARAQAETDRGADRTLIATGVLDSQRYEGILQPRALVGLQGAGWTHDGLYYVRSVTHRIRRGSYTQSFTLAREGVGSLTPAVPV